MPERVDSAVIVKNKAYFPSLEADGDKDHWIKVVSYFQKQFIINA